MITEASPFEFPQGATIDERNFLFEHQGNRRVKRKGLALRQTINWTLQHKPSDVTTTTARTGKPYYWRKYDITILPIVVQYTDSLNATFWTSEIHFYNASGTLLDSFRTGSDIAVRVHSIEEDAYDVKIVPIDDERLIINPNFLALPYFVDIEAVSSSITEVVVSSAALYSRDFAVLNTDDEPYVRSDYGPSATPAVDINYQYNVINNGWLKNIETSVALASNALEALELTIISDPDSNVQYPAMSDDVNLFMERSETTQNPFFNVENYTSSTPKGFLAPRGSQIISTDNTLQGRSISAITDETNTLFENLRFTL